MNRRNAFHFALFLLMTAQLGIGGAGISFAWEPRTLVRVEQVPMSDHLIVFTRTWRTERDDGLWMGGTEIGATDVYPFGVSVVKGVYEMSLKDPTNEALGIVLVGITSNTAGFRRIEAQENCETKEGKWLFEKDCGNKLVLGSISNAVGEVRVLSLVDENDVDYIHLNP